MQIPLEEYKTLEQAKARIKELEDIIFYGIQMGTRLQSGGCNIRKDHMDIINKLMELPPEKE